MTQPPGGAPPPSKRQVMRDAVSKVVQQVAEQRQAKTAEALAEQRRARQRQTRGILLVIVAVIGLVASVMWALPRWRHPFQDRSAALQDRDARTAILFAAKIVDRFTEARGRAPISLEEAGVNLPGIAYTTTGTTYQLVAVVDGKPLTFRSGISRDSFRIGR